MVNSRHKKAIKDCPNLDKVGFCEDGYPDVVEAKDKDNVISNFDDLLGYNLYDVFPEIKDDL